MARPSLQEIADAAKVSPATVSRVLNNRPLVAESTRTQVVDALRSLGGGFISEPVIGLILPDSSNPFFTELAFRLQDELQGKGLHLLIAASEGKLDQESYLLDQFKGLNVSGLIYIGAGANSEALLGLVAEGVLPVVVLDRRLRAGNLDSVVTSSFVATRAAVSFLVAQGHSRVGYLSGLPETETAQHRLESFTEAMSHNGLSLDERHLIHGDYSLSAGQKCGQRVTEMKASERPTAMVVANDLMAIGMMQRCQELGMSIPMDLSVIGFDGIALGAGVYPALTTIEQPVAQLVGATARLLIMRVAQYSADIASVTSPELMEFDCRLVLRKSAGPAPA
jgi:LacI family transcriptional regulator